MINKSKLIISLIALLLLALVFTGCRWGGKQPPDETSSGPLSPDYPLPPEDTGAETIEGEDTNGGKLDAPEGGSSVGLIYMIEAELEIASGNIELLFGNPSKSNQDMVVSISIQDHIVARSGLLKPGMQVRELSLSTEGIALITKPGVYEAKFVIDNYDPISGEKAIVNIEIPITITAK